MSPSQSIPFIRHAALALALFNGAALPGCRAPAENARSQRQTTRERALIPAAARACRASGDPRQCAGLFSENACRQAYHRAASTPFAGYREVLEACRSTYCARLGGNQPALCLRRPQTEPLHRWFHLQAAFADAVGQHEGARGLDRATYGFAFQVLRAVKARWRLRRAGGTRDALSLEIRIDGERLVLTLGTAPQRRWILPRLPEPADLQPVLLALGARLQTSTLELRLSGEVPIVTLQRLHHALDWAGAAGPRHLVSLQGARLHCREGDGLDPVERHRLQRMAPGTAVARVRRGGLWLRGQRIVTFTGDRISEDQLRDGRDGYLIHPLAKRWTRASINALLLTLDGDATLSARQLASIQYTLQSTRRTAATKAPTERARAARATLLMQCGPRDPAASPAPASR